MAVKHRLSTIGKRSRRHDRRMAQHRIVEVMAAAATPISADGTVDRALYLDHLRRLLARGCDGVVVFGTTGEGPAFGTAERRAVLDDVIEAGIPAEKLVMAAMSAAAADIHELCRHAANAGVHRLLVMPPFFFRGAARPVGLERFYADLVEGLGDDRIRLLFYHFPEMSGAAITPDLAMALRRRFGAVIDGLKDSAGVLDQTLATIQKLPELRVLVGTEVHLPQAVAAGGAGTICGLANVAPEIVRALTTVTDPAEAARLCGRLDALEALFGAEPFIVALKAVLAIQTGVDLWLTPLPPLSPLNAAAVDRMATGLQAWQVERHS
jgi:4-hydroxy-tetrahydrodipicolinate synthase